MSSVRHPIGYTPLLVFKLVQRSDQYIIFSMRNQCKFEAKLTLRPIFLERGVTFVGIHF